MTPKEYDDTFEQMAKDFKPISHMLNGKKKFIIWKMDNSLSEISENLTKDGYGLILETFESDPQLNNAGQLIDQKRGAWWIVKHVVKRTTASENETINEAYLYAVQLLGRMYKLRDNDHVKYNFKFENNILQQVGPAFDNFFGWRYEFGFSDNIHALAMPKPELWP